MLNPPAKDWENTHIAVAAEREGVCEENAKVCLKNQKCLMRRISLLLLDFVRIIKYVQILTVVIYQIFTFGESLSLRKRYCFWASLMEEQIYFGTAETTELQSFKKIMIMNENYSF